MVLIVDPVPSRTEPLCSFLGREGLRASRVDAPPERGPRLAVAVVCVERARDLSLLTTVRERSGAERVLALVPDDLRVAAFEAGADDVTHLAPLSVRETTLRIRRLYLATPPVTAPSEPLPSFLRAPDRAVRVRGTWLTLTPAEFDLLAVLVTHADRALTREYLLRVAWDPSTAQLARTVDTTVKRLRARLGRSGDAIETVRGVGYRFASSRFEA